jgi:hypothetical protein
MDKLFAWALVLCVSFAVISCSDEISRNQSTVPVAAPVKETPTLSIANEKHGCDSCPHGWFWISGEITNSYTKPIRFVSVSFEWLSENDVILGTATDYYTDLRPNGTWRFRATTLVNSVREAKYYRIKEVKGMF